MYTVYAHFQLFIYLNTMICMKHTIIEHHHTTEVVGRISTNVVVTYTYKVWRVEEDPCTEMS